MKYPEIRAEHERRLSAIFADCGVFFAFSDSQFAESKTPLTEGDKYVSLGAGGYMPKSKVQEYITSVDALSAWQKEAVKQTKAADTILYHLHNHECFYLGDIEDALPVLEDLGYTQAEVQAVFNANYGRVMAEMC